MTVSRLSLYKARSQKKARLAVTSAWSFGFADGDVFVRKKDGWQAEVGVKSVIGSNACLQPQILADKTLCTALHANA